MTGTTESHRTPAGEPARYLLEVALPCQDEDCLTWPYARAADGRGVVYYKGRNHIASRLVCELTYGPPPTNRHQAAHGCGKGHEGCINPRHLRWATPRENETDKVAHGTAANIGERNFNAKLTEADVRAIREIGESKSQTEIAAEFGVTQGLISAIQLGKIWRHVV